MMMFGLLQVLMIALTGGGGGNELLDYITTEAYWQQRGVNVVDVQSMQARLATAEAADISRQLQNLGSSMPRVREAAGSEILGKGMAVLPQLEAVARSGNPDVAARAQELIDRLATQAQLVKVDRLMAMRALGELGDKAALTTLEPLLKSETLFEAQYAQEAVAHIQGKKYEAPKLTAEARMSDVWLLPADVGAVVQAVLPTGGKFDFKAILDKVPAVPLFGTEATPEMRAQLLAEYYKGFMEIAGRLGNVRIDSATLGVADNIGNHAGYVVVIVRGLYDPAAAKAALVETHANLELIGDTETYAPGGEMLMIPFAKDRFVFVAGPERELMPVAAVIESLKASKGKLESNEAITALIKTVDTTAELWGVMKVSAAYRLGSPLAAFDTVTMSSVRKGEMTDITITAKGSDKEKVAQAVSMMQGQVAMALNEMKGQMAEQEGLAPTMEPMIKIMESIEIKAQDDTATIKAQVKGNMVNALLLPLMGMGMMF